MRYAALVLLCFASELQAQDTTRARPGDDLVGLWGSEPVFGPQVRGEAILERAKGIWALRVAGFEASAPVTGDSIHIQLTGGQGELRARSGGTVTAVRGFWFQAEGNLGRFATPISLAQERANLWRGPVPVLEDRFSMYFLIQRMDDSTLKGAFQNPEVNWNGRSPWFRVRRDGENLVLVDPASGRERFRQPYDSSQRQITMDFGDPFVLRPRATDQAVGYYPRSPGTTYEYRVPAPGRDGWTSARAADVGLDEAALAALVRRIASADPATADLRLHSLLIARRGKLVLEEYFRGYSAERPHDVRSASKTFTSMMAGIAMDRGAGFSMDTPVYSLFPGSASGANNDPRKQRITVGQLLTHTTGLACDDNDDSSQGNEDTMQRQRQQRDWYRYVLDLAVVHEPGANYAYCSGGMNLVGGVVRQTTGTSLLEFFDREIARPLQFERYFVNLMPSGDGYAGGGIYMRPRDLLKLGQTYLAGGIWNGKRIVSRQWAERSVAHQVSAPNGGSDGFGWHRYQLSAGGRTYQEYEANGNGGQFVIVIPELELVVVTTAGNYGQYRIWRTIRDELVPRDIIGALRR